MKNKFNLSTLVIISIAFVNGCTKEGPAGPRGKDGNTDVQSCTITFSDWSWDASNGYAYADFKWPAITSSLNNSGTILVYLQTPGGWAQIPRSIYPNATYSQSQRYTYNTGTFKIIVQDSDLTQPVSLGTWTIKVLAIENCVKKANPYLDWSNYNEVKKILHLETDPHATSQIKLN
jgi:hypothetical protein